MHKIKIIEKSEKGYFQEMPLCYRVSITPRHGTKHPVTIIREFFRAGFNDGERFGKFFIQKNGDKGIRRISFLTKKVKDGDFLRRKEEEMVKMFIKECSDSIGIMEENIKEETKRLQRIKNGYIKTIDDLDDLFRSEKIKKVIEKIND